MAKEAGEVELEPPAEKAWQEEGGPPREEEKGEEKGVQPTLEFFSLVDNLDYRILLCYFQWRRLDLLRSEAKDITLEEELYNYLLEEMREWTMVLEDAQSFLAAWMPTVASFYPEKLWR